MINTKKVYYSIREVCESTDLEAHVLRYWESEFSTLRPKKNRAGNRAYRKKDIEVVEKIKYLLYDEQYTIPGARKKLAEMKEQLSIESNTEPANVNTENINNTYTVNELKSILEELS